MTFLTSLSKFSGVGALAPLFRSPVVVVTGVSMMVSACMSPGSTTRNRPDLSKKVVNYGQVVPKGGGHYKIGRPYQIANKWYRPRENPNYDRVGIASWYGDLFHGRKTANGEVFDMDALTAAHPTLPLPTLVRVTNLANNRSLVVRVNDRGPYRHNRLIDLSRKAATILGFKKKGMAKVRVKYIGRAPMNGDDRFEKRVLAQNLPQRNRRFKNRRAGHYSPSSAASGANRSYHQSYGRTTSSQDDGFGADYGFSFAR